MVEPASWLRLQHHITHSNGYLKVFSASQDPKRPEKTILAVPTDALYTF